MISYGVAMQKWSELQPHLLQMLGDEEYNTWVSPLDVREETEESLVLTSDNPIVVDWIRDHLISDLEAVARSRFGRNFQIRLSNRQQPTTPSNQKTATAENNYPAPDATVYLRPFCHWSVESICLRRSRRGRRTPRRNL